MLHHNIRSFRKNFDEVSAFLSLLSHRFQVLVFSETWFDNDSVMEISGYKSYHSYRSGRVGGGVSVYVSDILRSTCVEELTLNGDIFETCCVKVNHNNQDIYVLGTYRPPNLTDYDLFIENFSEMLSLFHVFNKCIYILGDFNVNTMNLDNVASRFVELMRSLFFLPLIDVPTRVTSNTETLIDNIWTNQLVQVISGVFSADISDHFPIFVSLPMFPPSDKVHKRFRDHSLNSITNLRQRVQVFVRDTDFGDSDDVDRSMQMFVHGLTGIYDKCCPIRTKHLPITSFTKPWINAQLRSLVKQKHHYFRQYKAGTVPFDVYNSYKNAVTSALKKARREYFCSKFNQSLRPKETWKLLNKLLNKNKRKNVDISLVNGGGVTTSPKQIANAFNDYFANVACDIDRNIPLSTTDPSLLPSSIND